MPVTRSATKQVKLDDFTDEKNNIKPTDSVGTKVKKAETTNQTKSREKVKQTIPQKRGSPSQPTNSTASSKETSASKRSKKTPAQDGEQQTLSTENINDFEEPIMINRSPVLQLWGAMVAQFLHPDLSWEACLSIGNAISALCAVTKGRAIGVIDTKEDTDADDNAKRKKAEQKQKAGDGTRELSVMGFPMNLKNSTVVLSGKSKGLNESTLRNKFGDEGYEQTKKAMVAGLETWKDEPDELDRKAFHMYEKFRPNVQQGQQGWGRKGELNPHQVTSIIKR